MINLGPQQAAAVPRFGSWLSRFQAGDRSVPPGFVVLGLGGTGKTTLARVLVEAAGLAAEDVAGGALQASAASKLHEVTGWDCRTLHRWNYKVEARVGGQSWFTFNPKSPLLGFRLLVIDEISQVSLDLWNHTLAHGVPVLVLGDPGQLNAVAGQSVAPYLQPDVELTEIHRQAAGSPIIHWSMAVRNGSNVPFGDHRDSVTGQVTLRKLWQSELSAADYANASVVLVARNSTRQTMNRQQRRHLGFADPLPMVGEKVVCRRNQMEHGLVNAHSGIVLEAAKDRSRVAYTMTMRINETKVIVPARPCSKDALGLLVAPPCPPFLAKDLSDMAYGYVHTVHAFIGRQADHVLVIDEYPQTPDRRRWLYTAISRGAKTVTIAVPDQDAGADTGF